MKYLGIAIFLTGVLSLWWGTFRSGGPLIRYVVQEQYKQLESVESENFTKDEVRQYIFATAETYHDKISYPFIATALLLSGGIIFVYSAKR